MSIRTQFLVKVDLKKLHSNLSFAWRKQLTMRDAREFLRWAGFRPVAAGWVAEEDHLMRLDPSEVISADRIEPSSPSRGRDGLPQDPFGADAGDEDGDGWALPQTSAR